MIRPRFRVNSVNSVFFENEKTDSLPSQSVFTHHNKKKTIFFYRNLSNKKKTIFFLQKSKIYLQKYQKSIFTHHNKIKNHFFFRNMRFLFKREPEKTKSNSCRVELEPEETGELREKRRSPTPWSRYVSLLFFFFLFFLSFFLFIFSFFALSSIENIERGFGFLFYFFNTNQNDVVLVYLGPKRRRFG